MSWHHRLKLRRDPAYRQSRELLLQHLTPAQHEQLATRHNILVLGSDGWLYIVHERVSYNVSLADAPNYYGCAAPLGRLPVYDVMLAAMLALETDAVAFRAVAWPWHGS